MLIGDSGADFVAVYHWKVTVEQHDLVVLVDDGGQSGGSIALLVGGIGVANTMIISVLERRREIGLRRALGATRGHILTQFLAEALLLSALGGMFGSVLGTVATWVMTLINDWPLALSPVVFAIAVGATLVGGAIAGFYPAVRAARTPPTAALNS